MTDYKAAFEQGQEAARQADRARKEIDTVLQEFATALADAGQGKLKLTLRTYEVSDSKWFLAITFPPTPKEMYTAITAVNPTVKSPIVQLAKWKPGPTGYPCMIAWTGQERFCEDKEALQRCLAELVADPMIGEKLLSLVSLEEEPEQKEEAQQSPP
jgi:hypothetical protein